jgi:hypothetical protein
MVLTAFPVDLSAIKALETNGRQEDFWFIVARSKEAKMRQKSGPQQPAVLSDISALETNAW